MLSNPRDHINCHPMDMADLRRKSRGELASLFQELNYYCLYDGGHYTVLKISMQETMNRIEHILYGGQISVDEHHIHLSAAPQEYHVRTPLPLQDVRTYAVPQEVYIEASSPQNIHVHEPPPRGFMHTPARPRVVVHAQPPPQVIVQAQPRPRIVYNHTLQTQTMVRRHGAQPYERPAPEPSHVDYKPRTKNQGTNEKKNNG
jgi:hypothetical protein